MTDAELEAFPHGITQLEADGTIRLFNAAEANFIGRKPEETVGLNFFRDVAPCAAVRNFQGRFNEFVATPDATSKTFGFIYPTWLKHRQVKITMVRRRADPASVLLVTEFADSAPFD